MQRHTTFFRISVKNNHFFDYIVLLRPDLIILTLAPILLGYHKGLFFYNTTSNLNVFDTIIWSYPPSFIMICLSYVLVSSSTYVINQITDVEIDKLNGKGLMIASGRISRKSAIYVSVFTFLAGFAIIFLYYSLDIFVLSVVAAIIGLAYSIPPLRLKGKPFWDLLCNAGSYGLVAFAGGWVLSNTLDEQIIYIASPYIFNFSAIYIVSALVDVEGDKLMGIRTTAVFLGKKTSLFTATLLSGFSIIAAIYNEDLFILLPSVVSFFLYFRVISSPKPRDVKLSYRISGFITTLFILLPQPIFLLFLLCFFGVWRILYYDFIH